MRAVAVILVAFLLAGCTRLDPEAAPTAAPPASQTPGAVELSTPDALVERPLVALVEPRWVRPGEVMNASAQADGVVDWFVASRNPIRAATPPPLAERAQPNSSALLALREPGRHAFLVGTADLSVSIVPGAAPTALVVVASQEDGEWRVVPQALRAGVGSSLHVENRASRDVLVKRLDLHPYVATGAATAFAMPETLELGDYDVLAVTVGQKAVGENATRVIYDARKPEAAWDAGPFTGSFQAAATAQPSRHVWEADWEARNVTVAFSASSGAPAPFTVRASLVDADGAEVAGGAPPGFDVAALPKGAYAFVVTASEGMLVEYELSARGEWVLTPPTSLFNS